MNPLYNNILYNSKIRYNVYLVCTKISGSCIFSFRGDSNKYIKLMIYEKKNFKSVRCSCFRRVLHCKNIRRFYGKITGNQLTVHFPLFLQAPVNIFRNQAHYGSKDTIVVVFLSYSPTILQRYFRVLSVNITLPYLDF